MFIDGFDNIDLTSTDESIFEGLDRHIRYDSKRAKEFMETFRRIAALELKKNRSCYVRTTEDL